MPVYNGPDQPWQVGTVTPIAPDGTPTANVTAGVPQTLSMSIPSGGTRIQKGVVTTNAAGVATWVFPSSFASVPVVDATAMSASSSEVFSVQITSITTRQVVLQVFRATTIAVALISLSVQVLATPGATDVHVVAIGNPN